MDTPVTVSPPLYFRLASLVRSVQPRVEDQPQGQADIVRIELTGEWIRAACEALAQFDAKGYTADEPIFILRGRDELAADSVKHWAAKGYIARVFPPKLVEALQIADRMEQHPGRRLPD